VKPGSSRTRHAALASLVVVAAFTLMPALASARITVPPGSSEGDQYFEEIPNGAGSGGPERGGDAGGLGGGQAGSGNGQAVAAAQALSALGAEGAAAADVANANRPPIGAETQGDEPASSSTEGEGGLGSVFPVLIAITVLGAIAYGLRQRLNPA
jgi:hypothetical protein